MPELTFVHAADLHLGAPFRGLDAAASEVFADRGGSLGDILSEATFDALARLEATCLEAKADFLLLSGDIYDDRDGVLRARFALRDMFARLERAGVSVFIAHGNHDPLREGREPVRWPGNVFVFSKEVSCVCVMKEGAPLALVHGVSHATARENENLSKRFMRYTPGRAGEAYFSLLPEDVPADIFQAAVLHCAVGGAGEGHAPYAPCTLSDLTGAGFDYWALGHVHQGRVLSEKPFVAYPGSMQGMHINETGAHGCLVAKVTAGGMAVSHVPLAPVVWEKAHYDLAAHDGQTVDDLETALLGVLEDRVRAAAEGAGGAGPKALFCRLVLGGRTGLDAVLRKPGSVATLLERLRKECAADDDGGQTAVWVKDIILETLPERDMAGIAERDDLVGEVARLAASADPNAFAEALEPLYGHHRLKKILAACDAPENTGAGQGADRAALASSAGALLISLLEDE